MMPKLAAAVALLIVLALLTGCSSDDDAPPAPGPTSSASPASPTSPATSPGPGANAPSANAYAIAQVFPHIVLPEMLGMFVYPDDPTLAIILTRTGVAYRANLADTDEAPSVFLDISERMIAEPRREEGLLGFAFSPSYDTDRLVYVYFTAGEPRRSVVAAFVSKGDAADPTSETVILEVAQPFANHNGGALAFGPDKLLYIALGDGGSSGDPQGNGQNTDTLLGSILRIDVSVRPYAIPADNPFAAGGGRGEIWAYGLRNPWRISFDRETGDLWAGDVGQGAFEEIDRIGRGLNYGWNVTEGDACFRAETCDRTGLTAPRTAYSHDDGCSVTGGYVYRGALLPELRGWYIYADYCSGKVWALDAADDATDPVPLMDTGKPITSFAQDPGGEVYLITFDNAIYQITPE